MPLDTGLDGITPTGDGFFLTLAGLCLVRGG